MSAADGRGPALSAAKVTVRELRQILFDIDEQDLTVREVRAILFDIDEQDSPVDARAIRRAS